MSRKKEGLFWADQLADAIINRKRYNYINKRVQNPKILTIKSSTSISGVPHIGNASDVIRHEAVVRVLKDKGKKVRFIWVAEDMDAFRKVPSGIPKSFEKYLGKPVADIPCPKRCCKSYSKHFQKLFAGSLTRYFGADLEIKSSAEAYRKGELYPFIKKVMANLDTVREIINKSREDPLPRNWNPWKPVCDKCGKIMTTVVTGMSKEGVNYECRDFEFRTYGKEAYTKLKGCGYKGVSNLKKGNGKMLWRVEWGMLWANWKVVLEGAGKEHFMPTGSFWSAGEVAERVLDWPEPHPAKNPIQGYEYLIFDGEKMSASRGNVVATWDWPVFANPEILKLFMLKKPSKVRDVPLIEIHRSYDELDELEKVYFGKTKLTNKKEEAQSRRLYELSTVKRNKRLLQRVPYSYCVVLAQTVPNVNSKLIKTILERTGYKLNAEELKAAIHRIKLASEWIKRYLPESERIIIQTKARVKLSASQKEAIKDLIKSLSKNLNEKQLFNEFHSIVKKNNLKAPQFFQAVYKVLLNKERGPRLAPFILAVGRAKVAKLLKQSL